MLSSSFTAPRHPHQHPILTPSWDFPSARQVLLAIDLIHPRNAQTQLCTSKVPNETYKAAAHLVVTGKKRRFCNVKIILAHLGGSTLFLAPRVAALSHYMGCPLAPDEILEDFKTFYYETALSSHPTTLAALDAFVPIDRILFGSDYPGKCILPLIGLRIYSLIELKTSAVSTATSRWYTRHLEDHYADEPRKLVCILRDNALTLFPRLRP